jgi:GTP cyclohydrolase I
MKNIKEITWDDILSRLQEIQITHNITKDTMVYGVPKNGMILAGFLNCHQIVDPSHAEIIIDDLIDSGRTKAKYTSMFPKAKFIHLFEPGKEWLHFPFEKKVSEDQEDCLVRLLEIIGEDVNREGVKETPKRALKMWKEVTEKPKLNITTFDSKGYDQMIISKDITYYTFCEHHMIPFFGTCSIGYIPNKRIIGLSKLARTVDYFAKGLNTQEYMTQNIANFLQKELNPKGLGVLTKGRHLCQEMRGIKKEGQMITTALKGAMFDKLEVRNEFLDAIK